MINIPISILVVDDERDFVEMLSLRLSDAGHVIKAAFDGRQALEILETWEPDVVILDIRMPGLDGMETLKRIKAKHPIVEVILLTGHGAIDTAVDGMKSGAFDYLLKPAEHEELLEKLRGAQKRKIEQEERIRKAEARSMIRRTGGT